MVCKMRGEQEGGQHYQGSGGHIPTFRQSNAGGSNRCQNQALPLHGSGKHDQCAEHQATGQPQRRRIWSAQQGERHILCEVAARSQKQEQCHIPKRGARGMRLGIRLLEINHVPAHGEASSLYLMAMAGSAGAATDRSASAHPILQGNVRQAHNVGSSCRSRIHYVLFTCGGTKKRHKVALEGMGTVPELVCATFDAFEAHLISFDGRYHLTGPERGEWRSQAFCVERILVQLVSEGAACAYEGSILHGWATLFVPRSPPQWYRMLGGPMDDRSLIHFAPGQEFRAAVNNANQWLSLSAPAELLQSGIDNDTSAIQVNRCL